MFEQPNLWDQPVSLAREHGRATPDTPTGPGRPGSGKHLSAKNSSTDYTRG